MFGILGAFAAAVAYGAATVVQAVGVRDMAAADSRIRWRGTMRFGGGLALDLVGFLASFAALRELPLFFVEAAVASSIAVTALLAALLRHVRLGVADIAGLALTGLGMVLLALSAAAGPARRLGDKPGWALLLTGVLLAAVVAVIWRRESQAFDAVVLALFSGLGFGFVGIAARTIELRHPWNLLLHPTLWALLVHAAVAVVAYGLALSRGRVVAVAAITFAAETVMPAAIGLGFLGDAVRPHFVLVAASGFIATLGGSIMLAAQAEPAVSGPARRE